MDNPAIRVREWDKPVPLEWLEKQFRHRGEFRLIVDGSKQLTLLAYVRQLIPVLMGYRYAALCGSPLGNLQNAG